jgi:hypothetical protein
MQAIPSLVVVRRSASPPASIRIRATSRCPCAQAWMQEIPSLVARGVGSGPAVAPSRRQRRTVRCRPPRRASQRAHTKGRPLRPPAAPAPLPAPAAPLPLHCLRPQAGPGRPQARRASRAGRRRPRQPARAPRPAAGAGQALRPRPAGGRSVAARTASAAAAYRPATARSSGVRPARSRAPARRAPAGRERR